MPTAKQADTAKMLENISRARLMYKKHDHESAIKLILKVKREAVKATSQKKNKIVELCNELIRELSDKIKT